MRFACRKTKDPWKTTRLIGRACTGSNAFSGAVRTVECLITNQPPRFRSSHLPPQMRWALPLSSASAVESEQLVAALQEFCSRDFNHAVRSRSLLFLFTRATDLGFAGSVLVGPFPSASRLVPDAECRVPSSSSFAVCSDGPPKGRPTRFVGDHKR